MKDDDKWNIFIVIILREKRIIWKQTNLTSGSQFSFNARLAEVWRTEKKKTSMRHWIQERASNTIQGACILYFQLHCWPYEYHFFFISVRLRSIQRKNFHKFWIIFGMMIKAANPFLRIAITVAHLMSQINNLLWVLTRKNTTNKKDVS